MTADPSELSPIKRALLEIRDLRARLAEVEQAQSEPIAITGAGLRFPGGATNLDSFWRLLQDGVDVIREIPASRWSLETYYDADASKPGKMTTRYGSFLDDVDQFDAAFFGISPREAVSMDPQQRLLLETAWEALENAGQSPEALLGSQTGVFIGIANADYYRMVVGDPDKIDTYASTGGAFSVAAGRISYLLGLRGPAISVDTACSSSLVSIHLACQSLRKRECDLALAGGVNLILTPEANINFSKAGMMAADGHCKTFDAAADGYVRGEGCAVITLKRLSDALAAGDPILAVVRGSVINQDGRSSGLTAPSGPAQEAVIRAALESAALAPHQVGYVEAHGTGTALGDPIEVRALGEVYSRDRAAAHPLLVGSVKTNLGHTEAAAGIAGVIKVALALQHREIPPHLHFQTPNPHIAWADYPLSVPVERTPWQPVDGLRIGAVSSFGFSGTNAHIILAEAPARPAAPDNAPSFTGLRLTTLSARSEAALRALAARYQALLEQNSLTQSDFSALARASAVERAHYPHRLALAAATPADLGSGLNAYLDGKNTTWWQGHSLPGDTPAVAFLFTGHGSHYVNMGRELYETEPVFHAVMDQCDAFLRDRLPKGLLAVLYPESDSSSADLDDMTYGQPAMFALQFALASLWRSWGVEPAAVAGHSLGEYAAAVIAGVMSLEDGLTLIAERGRLMQQLPEDGRMATIFAPEDVVAALVAPHAARVSIAALNSPEAVVISGYGDSVQTVLDAAAAQGLRSKALNIYRAAHSPVVEAMLPGIARTTAAMTFREPQIEFFSTVTGGLVSAEIAEAVYWQRHLRQPVRFAAAVQALYAAGYRVFVEIGPHPTLLSLAQRTLPDANNALWLPSLRENMPARAQILESLASLYVHGAEINWSAAQPPAPRPALRLPTYPWDRKNYWWDATPLHKAAPVASAWDSAVNAAHRQAQQTPLDLNIAAFPARWGALDHLSAAYIANALRSLGAFRRPGERHNPQTLLEHFGVKPTYRALMARWLRQLSACGWLRRDEDGFYVSERPLPAQDIATPRAEVERLLDAPQVTEYINACGERLAEVITGAESPLELIFPGGSMQRAENLYQHWAHARYFHNIVAATVEAIAHADPAKTLRLLEIGAGIGSTTAGVLSVLPLSRSEYHFTDVSDIFLDHARQKFAAYPFVRYGLFDVEKDGLEQGYGRGQFDVILAGNVLHATRSLSDTLRNVRSLLAPGGLLVLFEATHNLNWFDITTALIEGWQSFEDDLRSDSPLLSAAQWQPILAEAGFSDVFIAPQPGSPAEILAESVILARPHPATDVPPLAGLDLRESSAQAAPEQPAPQPDFLRELAAALPDERREMLTNFVRTHVISVLRLDPDNPPDRKARLMDVGVDSLMAVELRGRLSLGLKLAKKLPATLIFDYPSIEAITSYLLHDVLVFEQPAARAPAPADIAALSDEQVEAMLLAKLKKMQ